MSKNSKNARRHATARAVSAQRKKGNKGGGMTKKLTTKRLTWHAKKDGKLGGALLAAAERMLAREAGKEVPEE